jgi:NAD(P)-dependent dehydrogenase (short-subunit alcohol dehydrogenase family)
MSERCFLITGAPRGLGRAIALHLARPGHRLLLHYHTHAEEAVDLARLARNQGAQAETLQADLAQADERDRLMDQVAALAPALYGLINNVGIYLEAGLLEITPAQWSHVLEATCSAVFHLTRRAVPLLRAGAPARVINIGDSAADRVTARVRATPYHVAKLGVHVLTRSFAKALAGDRITVNQISPGFLENSVGSTESPIPAGRPGRFTDILAALDFLLAPEAEYTTGSNIIVSGGWNL